MATAGILAGEGREHMRVVVAKAFGMPDRQDQEHLDDVAEVIVAADGTYRRQ